MNREPQDIIVRPLLTEKGTKIQEHVNQYFFEVRKDANKIEIRKAVEKLFDVKVVSVNTLRLPGKWKRLGKSVGRSTGWKKAVVTLREGEVIELFEGV
jgi:large subunit ribosomal protein L23